MATAKSSDNTILALYPPHAPEATTPVVGAVYGVPKHVYDLKPMGLTIVVDPPPDDLLEEGDVEEALNAASSIGDDRLQKQSRGYVTPDSFTHGTSEQRVRWFSNGFRSGDINACKTFQAKSL